MSSPIVLGKGGSGFDVREISLSVARWHILLSSLDVAIGTMVVLWRASEIQHGEAKIGARIAKVCLYRNRYNIPSMSQKPTSRSDKIGSELRRSITPYLANGIQSWSTKAALLPTWPKIGRMTSEALQLTIADIFCWTMRFSQRSWMTRCGGWGLTADLWPRNTSYERQNRPWAAEQLADNASRP